jgi:dienelactone hydrolase
MSSPGLHKKFLLTVLGLWLAACQPTPEMIPTNTARPPAVRTLTLEPSATQKSPEPSQTPVRDILYPYTIDGLLERNYPAGKILIGETLATTAEYTRYAISYDSDGLTISGVMQVPPGGGPFPVILMSHGYFNRDEYLSGDGTSLVADVLNQHGYLTIASDYRGWGASDAGPSLFHTGLVIDVLHLLNAIPSVPQADPDRIGIWGHSMGGGITTKILTVDPRIRAAVLYAPNSADDADLIARWGYGCLGDINPGRCNSADMLPVDLSPELVQAYIDAANDPQQLHEIAPIYHLEHIQTPIQIHIGEADGDYIGSTPPEWSYKLYDALLAAGKPVELFRYPGQRHSFNGESRELFLQRILAFFDLYLK